MDKKEVILAKTAGFCFGVKRAMDTVYDRIDNSNNDVYTLGPIIHNEEVVSELKSKGVNTINELDEIPAGSDSEIIIRSHGVGKEIYEIIEKHNFKITDATCPFVKKIHNIVSSDEMKDKTIIIAGDSKHAEVEGIKGWCITEPFIVKSVNDCEKLLNIIKNDIVFVSQTTFNVNNFKDIVEFFRKKRYNITVYNTICNATSERQKEAYELSKTVDVMIVIGGKNSSNTQKLYEISKAQCKNTYYIQTLVDLDLTAIESVKRVGITAGASTPNNIIKEVHDACQKVLKNY